MVEVFRLQIPSKIAKWVSLTRHQMDHFVNSRNGKTMIKLLWAFVICQEASSLLLIGGYIQEHCTSKFTNRWLCRQYKPRDASLQSMGWRMRGQQSCYNKSTVEDVTRLLSFAFVSAGLFWTHWCWKVRCWTRVKNYSSQDGFSQMLRLLIWLHQWRTMAWFV